MPEREWLVHEWGNKFLVVESQVMVSGEPGITMAGQRIIAREITKANAHLIAKSPQLAEMLRELLDAIGNPMEIPPYEVVEKASKLLQTLDL